MQECLGINITDKLIKYAKVQKDEQSFKVLSYGIKFYEELELKNTIQQIIAESNSTRTPISINIEKEKYYYFDLFNLTNKTYIEKAIETEFESFCTENHLNLNALEGRYIYSKNVENGDKNKVIYIYESKGDLSERIKLFQGSNLVSAVPTPMTLQNIARIEKGKNIMIVDLNSRTTITTIIDQNIYSIDTLESGMKKAFDEIYARENSYPKVYEVCKNTTIYTMEMQPDDAENQNNEYLQTIVPVLYNTAQEIVNLSKNYKKIDKIYISGIGSTISNIELYFQEFMTETKVEVLKPFFVENNTSINIKDYIEVNSAIALAIQGMGYGAKTLNFCKNDRFKNIKKLLTADVSDLKGFKKTKTPKQPKEKGAGTHKIKNLGANFGTGFGNAIGTKFKPYFAMGTAAVLFTTIAYCTASSIVGNQIMAKTKSTQEVIDDTTKQIQLANDSDNKIQQRTMDYIKYKTNLENINSAIENKRSRKNQIPNLLNRLVYVTPKGVKITEIKNTEVAKDGKTLEHIFIYAQATNYEQLAYFKAKLKNANILDNIVSTLGTKQDQLIDALSSGKEGVAKVVIEGDLKSYY